MFKILLSVMLILNSLVLFPAFSPKAEELDTKIYGTSYVVIDGETKEVILSKDANERMYPASITKLLTAILLADNMSPSDTLEFTENAKNMPEYSVNTNYYSMDVGQNLSGDFVMKSVLIFSANDMSRVVADNLEKKLGKSFEEIANDKLKELGISNTYFVNATGLHDEKHYSTAYDLAILLSEALKYDWIRDTIGIKQTTVVLPDGSYVVYENSNKILGQDGMIGGKTGYTSKAGRTLVGAFERNDKTYIATVLNSVYDAQDIYVFNDMLNIVNIAEDKKKELYIDSKEQYGTQDIDYRLFGFFGPKKTIQVPIYLQEDIYMYDNDFNSSNVVTEIILNDNINVFAMNNTPIGNLEVKILDNINKYNIVTNISFMDIFRENILVYSITLCVVILVVIFIFIIFSRIFRNKKKKSKNIWK